MFLVNGNVITMDPGRPRAEAVFVEGDRINAVGATREVTAAAPPGEVIDLAGRTVIPGFNDAHAHLIHAGHALLDVNLAHDLAPDIAAIQRLIAERARTTPAGRWIVGMSYDFAKLAERRHPTRQELDAATMDHPVFLRHVSGHVGVANSLGLARLGYTRDSPDPAGGRLGRDAETGELDGRLNETATRPADPSAEGPPAKTPEENRRAFEAIGRKALSLGLTSATDASVHPDGLAMYRAMAAERALPIRVRLLADSTYLDEFLALDLPADDWLKVIGFKIFADGAIAGWTARLSEPYEGTDDRGILTIEPAVLRERVMAIHCAGYPACTHANGDVTIAMTLDAIEAAMSAHPRPDPRHRLEHGTVMTPDLIARTKRLGVVVVPFGSYVWHHGEKMHAYGRRIEMMFAHRSLLDAGVAVAGSTDHPCAPLDPLLAVQSCVLRQGHNGESLGPGQRITAEEAIRVYTVGSAYAAFDEQEKGMIRPGMLADLTVLADDPTAVDPTSIKDIPIDLTIVGGRVAYER